MSFLENCFTNTQQDPDLAFRVSARRGLIVLSEFCRPQAMQIAVGIDRHRCLVAQLKSRSGCLARMEITDVTALRRFHIEPLDNTDYPIFHLCYPLQLPICRVQYTTPNRVLKEPMYAARRRQKSVRGKFQFGKLRIGQKFQFFDNALRQLP